MSNNIDELALVAKLKSMDSDLFRDLQGIEQFCKDVWKDRLLSWFTNHDVAHSEEIIFILNQLLTPLEGSNSKLTKHELFVLLASAYLHDIGMQFLKCDDIPIDKLTEKEYEEVRRRHAELSSEIIIKRVAKSIDRDDFHVPNCIDEQYIPPIARVCKGHSGEYFTEVINSFGESPCTPKGRPFRGELLTALLLIADELDLQCNRVNFDDIAKFNLSTYSMVHWYKHHYLDCVNISNNSVKITLKYPPDSVNYKQLIGELIKTKLDEQIKKVNPYLRKETNGVLSLDDHVNFIVLEDDISMKRPMPANVITELKRLLGKMVPLQLPVSPVTIPHISRIPEPTPLFTGMDQKKIEFKDLLVKSNLISVEGLGGIGKTEFILKCISQFLPREKVVLFDCLPDSKVDALIEVSGYPEVLKGENKTERSKYSGFIDLIEKDEKTLFLDNFQSVTGNSFEEFFKFAEKRLKKARIILVTREHPDIGAKFVSFELSGLGDDALEYAQKFKAEYFKTLMVNDYDLKNICSNLGGHPLAIELALQLLNYGESPRNIISRIAQAKGKSRDLSDRLLDEVFSHPKSTQEEKDFLLRFSVFRTGIDGNDISFLFNGRDLSTTLYKLIDKKMVSVTNGMYNTHPLIREFCYQKLSDKEAAHEKTASHLEMRRTDHFDRLLEEEIFYHISSSNNPDRTANFISNTGDKFILSGHTNSLSEMINRTLARGLDRPEYKIFLGDIATLRGEWADASRYFDEAFSSNDADDKMTAEAYIKFGEILYRKGGLKEALKYFEDAHELCNKYSYKKEQGRSANDIGLVFFTLGDVQEAEDGSVGDWMLEGILVTTKVSPFRSTG